MRQPRHQPTEPYDIADPVINGKRVYGPGEVPEGLLTFRQLEKLQPPRKYAPDQKPAAWLRIVNRPRHQPAITSLTALYTLADSIYKRANSPAQLAVQKAMHDQHRICDYCGQKTMQHLLPEQICCECAAEFRYTEILRSRSARRDSCLDRRSALCCPRFRFPQDYK
jgi:hypothetical protein